jgi:hypothetical protein
LDAPVLEPIDNTASEGSYLVKWSAVPTTPVTYTLEQANNQDFVTPKVVYSGTSLTLPVEGQTVGTWHYRVRAFGVSGKSPWSGAVSTNVKGRVLLPLISRLYRLSPPDENWQTIMTEGFEGIFPESLWEVQDNRSDPEYFQEYYWDKSSCVSHSGASSGWAVGGGWDGQALGCGDPYPNNSESWMVYGPFSLADATGASLAYQAWLNVDTGDRLCHMASQDNRWYYGRCTASAMDQRQWLERTFDLTDVPTLGDLSGEPEVYVALIFQSDGEGTKAHGAYVDDLVLRKYVGPTSQVSTRAAAPEAGESLGEPASARRKQ